VFQASLLVLVVLFAFLCGCNAGTRTVVNGPVHAALLCDPKPRPDGCPSCSTPEGTRCRDQWYSAGLRCTSDAQCAASGACQAGFCVGVDADGDGLDDALENEVAELNFPTVILADGEDCGSPHGVLYHARRHPDAPRRLAISYVVLYADDCGELNGHTGDAETFAISVDLDAAPGAAATVGVEAWAHAGTVCGSTSSCETGAAMNGCGRQDVVIYASRDKHASYLSRETCDSNCFDSCGGGARIFGPLVNVGEPDHPTVTDLTTQSFVQLADGWDESLLHFNPWGTNEFGGGGRLDTPLLRVAPPGE